MHRGRDRQLLPRRPQHAERVGEFLGVEEAGLCVSDGETRFAVDEAVVLEEEQPDVAVFGVAGDPDLVLQRVAGEGRSPWYVSVQPSRR